MRLKKQKVTKSNFMLVLLSRKIRSLSWIGFLAEIPRRDRKSFLAPFPESGTAQKIVELPCVRIGGVNVPLENLQDLARE
jgi:hypothetical protein